MRLCLWDVFSDNQDVITADDRMADIGSFRAACAFLDEHLTRGQEGWRDGDYLRFYLGTSWISRRADLTPVYLIFRRLRSVGADWIYHFPQLYLAELVPSDSENEHAGTYSVSESAAAQLNEQKRCAQMAQIRAEIDEMNTRAREEAMDRPPPATVRAYVRCTDAIRAVGRPRNAADPSYLLRELGDDVSLLWEVRPTGAPDAAALQFANDDQAVLAI